MSRGLMHLSRASIFGRQTAAVALGVLSLLTACGSSAASPQAETAPAQLRLGYLANLTHAGALVGVEKGYFADAIGAPTELKTSVFNAGPDAQEAILSDSIDAAFFGPNPAINSFVQSHGQAIRIVAGATSGGAALVVRPSIGGPADL